ncbi:peptidylprolyl isomerase [Erythrobacter sp. THAF29]|uniref:peptidylprolyl isomerase n=1 Tax=Erythrobacter sp. THAF29 TaxID=2587851 RepID=UPI001267D1E1|nr:peptidylprolyl isomerase [Erythrobacter sp. THAF29]QFT78736.1 Cyclophilin type peptidyl-prolyl cis-trans isomerase/CLD [Erythrobacter sp. THAF29]
MRNSLVAATAVLALTLPASAKDEPKGAPSPNEIVAEAAAEEWVAIPAEDMLVMTLAPDADGNPREVVIQLMPAPFSQGWVENIRTLARAHWYDGISVNRVQDNYVVQWGDPGYDNPESGETETKPLPEGLNVMGEDDYTTRVPVKLISPDIAANFNPIVRDGWRAPILRDAYASSATFEHGWPFALRQYPDKSDRWPVHCYGMVGVGRNYSPDTGSGAELYTVIGHAPRHLDRNIALVGRIISGMEHLSSLPRGSGVLGFYTEEEADKRTPILSVRVASDLPEGERPQFEYLSTEGETFAKYAEARANRRDPFFIVPAGGADICNIPVPIRAVASE